MENLKEYIERHRTDPMKRSEFIVYLDVLREKYGFKKDSDLYNKAGVSRQNYSLIVSGSRPKLKTALKFIFALHANNRECKYLLKKAGYTLASSSTYALIIRYCLENKIYDLDKVNDYLIEYNFTGKEELF